MSRNNSDEDRHGKIKRLAVSDFKAGQEVRLPRELRVDYARIISIKDLAEVTTCAPNTFSQVEMECLHGPFKGCKFHSILNVSDELVFLKDPENTRAPMSRKDRTELALMSVFVCAMAFYISLNGFTLDPIRNLFN